MQAVRFHEFGGPEVLRVETLPDPVPSAGEVLIATAAIGINPFETYMRAGMYPELPLPHCPGRDAAGIIVAAGEGVVGLQPGDRVYVSNTVLGAYATMILAKSEFVDLLPAHLSFEQGAAVGTPCVTAWRALFQRGGARAGETVLIHGASGAVGQAAVQLALRAGLTVIGTAGSAEAMVQVKTLGAHHVFNHRDLGYQKMILDAAEGADVILEMLANVNLGEDCRMLRKHGRIVIIGSRGPVEINPRDLMNREADIRAMLLFNAPPELLAEAREGVWKALQDGSLNPGVTHRFPLADAAEAHKAVMDPTVTGKIVLITEPTG